MASLQPTPRSDWALTHHTPGGFLFHTRRLTKAPRAPPGTCSLWPNPCPGVGGVALDKKTTTPSGSRLRGVHPGFFPGSWVGFGALIEKCGLGVGGVGSGARGEGGGERHETTTIFPLAAANQSLVWL